MELQTPYYLLHKDKLDELVGEFRSALNRYWPNFIAGYSVKTNSLPWVIKYMGKNGFYAEVVSKDEYQLAKLLGFEKRIIYNGPIKSKESVLEAASNGCVINIDSKRELKWLLETERSFHIGVRVNIDIEEKCRGESQCGKEGGRFGFCYENGELETILGEIFASNLVLAGLHLHVSSKTRSLDIYRAIAEVCCEIKNKYSLELEYVDIGGGFFGGVAGKPKFDDYFREVSGILGNSFSCEHTKLIVEPGICLIGAPIEYVSSVVDVKNSKYNKFVITDASRTAIDPLFRKINYSYRINYGDNNRIIAQKQVVCGYTCMENDRIQVLSDLPELHEGDLIIYEKVGAYTMCLSPLFIEFFPSVYLLDGEDITEIRKRWTAEDYQNKGR